MGYIKGCRKTFVFLFTGELSKALELAIKSIDLYNKLNNDIDQMNLSIALVTGGTAAAGLKKLDISTEMFRRSLRIKESLEDSIGFAIIACHLGHFHLSGIPYREYCSAFKQNTSQI